MKGFYRNSLSCAALALTFSSASSFAQTLDNGAQQASNTDAILEDIVVTATKRAGGTQVQKAPVAITAFGEDQLAAMQIKDVSQVAFRAPSVSMDDIGTSKGVANFSIRGLGVNSSIPSIDPAVGVFVDGIYQGINAGVVFDAFDLKAIEVLRGPQGVLFGRNVTGGAVLINSSDPSDTLHYDFKTSATSGLRGTGGSYTVSGVVRGPLVEDLLSAKIGAYYNTDDGWFERTTPTGKKTFGQNETLLLRAGLKLTPSDAGSFLFKFEHGESDGDGPAAQSHTNGSGVRGAYGNFSRDTFDFAVDEVGYYDSEWDQISLEMNVEIGNGVLTNIAGYRRYYQLSLSDVDASPQDMFHANFDTKQRQISNELRYSGDIFTNVGLTMGLFYFTQKLFYNEHRRLIGGARHQYGGGVQDQETIGLFGNLELRITDALTVNGGIRWSHESKDDKVASLSRNVNLPCNVIAGTCPFDFTGKISKGSWSPRLGVQYEISPTVRSFANYSRAYRAGGFNFRNTAADLVNFGPGPFRDEKVDSWELGFKSEPFPRARFNVSGYYMTIGDMQREVNLSDPVAGVVQVIRNTADARIWGIEADVAIPLADGIVFDGSLGYVNGKYTKVIFDLNGDGSVNDRDKALTIPRLAPFTAHVGLTMERELPALGLSTLGLGYSHRDGSAYTDSNLGQLNSADRFDASLAVKVMDGRGTITVFGQNLTNDVQIGGDTQLPATLGGSALGGTFSPLSKGRVFGIELRLAN